MKYSARLLSIAHLLLFVATLITTSIAWAGSTVDRIAEKGELVLGTSANMPPMTHQQENGKVTGFDIDVARLMASAMNVELNIKVMPFSELLTALEQGEVDVVISNMTMNIERNMRVAFVGPYMTSGKCILTKHEALAKAQEAGDINVPETKVAALKSSTSVQFVNFLLPNATLVEVNSHDEGVKMIIDGKVGGMIADYPICMSVLKRYPDEGFVPLQSLINYEPIGVAVAGDDPLMINLTENFLKRMEGTGAFEELSQSWFGAAQTDISQ